MKTSPYRWFRLASYLITSTMLMAGVALYALLGWAFVLVINLLAQECRVPEPNLSTVLLYWLVISLTIFVLRSSKKD